MTAVCLTFDHLGSAQRVGQGLVQRPDPDEPGLTTGLPHIVRLLDEVGARGTFFVEGWSLLHYPAQVQALLEAGHEVALHGWVHERWTELDPLEQERILSDGLAALRLAGVEAPGFRAPHGCLSDATPGLLADLGYEFDSSLVSTDDDPPRTLRILPGGVTNVPFAWPMVDAWQYRVRADPLSAPELADAWLELARPILPPGAGEVVTLVAHPHISGVRPDATAAFDRVVRELAADDAVVLRRVGDVAGETGEPAGAAR